MSTTDHRPERATEPVEDIAQTRDAATLVIIDYDPAEPRVLMGRRRADQVFLPNKFVFPGGRVDAADLVTPVASVLSPLTAARLALGSDNSVAVEPERAQALAVAAVRELYEETGHLIGGPATRLIAHTSPLWSEAIAVGVLPNLGPLHFFARAITPPGRPRRYDTRFFAIDARHISFSSCGCDGELSELGWYSLGDARNLDLPVITRLIIDDLAAVLSKGQNSQLMQSIPFYNHRSGAFERALLSQPDGSA